MKPYFRNADLQIKSRQTLDNMARELKKKAFVLLHSKHRGVHRFFFEVPGTYSSSERTCERILNAFCRMIGRLSPAAAAEWDAAHSKVFDMGFSSGDENPPRIMDLSPEILTRIARLKISLRITLYPVDPDDDLIPQ